MNRFLSIFYFSIILLVPNIGGIYIGEIINLFLVFYIFVTRGITLSRFVFVFFLLGVAILFLILVSTLFSYALYGEGSIYYFLRFLRFLFWFLSIYIIKDIVINAHNKEFILNVVFPLIFVLHAFAIIITYVDFLGLREPLMTLSHADGLIFQTFRASGLWGGFDSAAIFMCIGTVFTLLISKNSIFIKIPLVVLFTLAGFLTSARVGFALLVMYFVIDALSRALSGNHKKFIYSLLSMFFITVSLILTANFGVDYLPEAFTSTVNRMSEIFVNEGSTSSTDHLLTMYYFPNDIYHILFGNSLDSFSSPNAVQSDVEYIKYVWGVGMPLSFLVFAYAFSILLFYPLVYKYDYNLKYFSTVLAIILIVGSLKGEYIFAFRFVPFSLWFIWMSKINCFDNASK